MKKIIIALAAILSIVSCRKTEVQTSPMQPRWSHVGVKPENDSLALMPMDGYNTKAHRSLDEVEEINRANGSGKGKGKPTINANQVTDLKATAVSTSEISLTFTAKTPPYYLYESGKGVINNPDGSVLTLSSGSYTVGGLLPGTTHSYYVAPVGNTSLVSNTATATTQNPPQPPPTSGSKAVIWLDFDPSVVTNASWGLTDKYLEGSGMSEAEIQDVVARMQVDYAPFNVTITTDSSVYAAADPYFRVRVIETQTDWYGTVGGVAFIGSINWGDNTPAFVFTNLLSFNSAYVARASSHEAGHTGGLHHAVNVCGESYAGIVYVNGLPYCQIMGGGYCEGRYWQNAANCAAYLTPDIDNTCATNVDEYAILREHFPK